MRQREATFSYEKSANPVHQRFRPTKPSMARFNLEGEIVLLLALHVNAKYEKHQGKVDN